MVVCWYVMASHKSYGCLTWCGKISLYVTSWYIHSSFICYSDLFPLDWLTRVTFMALNVVHPQSEQKEISTEKAAVSVSNEEE